MNTSQIKRVRFRNKPLIETICQFRFPPILRIDTEIPSAFQENIRRLFPVYEEKTEIKTKVEFAKNNKDIDIVNPLTQSLSFKNHVFYAEDLKLKVNLTRNFIALTANNYDTWEEFYKHLEFILNAFKDEYNPPYFSRIGLRYVNVFVRSKLSLKKSYNWDKLIEKPFLGLLSGDSAEQVATYDSTTELLLDNKCFSTIKTILVRNTEDSSNENCFMLDFDLYKKQKIELTEYKSLLDFLHNSSTMILQNAITQELYDLLEPQNL